MQLLHTIYMSAFVLWTLVSGNLYAFVAWLPPLKSRFALSQTVGLSIGTSLYVGWLIGLPLATFIDLGLKRCGVARQWKRDAIAYGIGTIFAVSCYVILWALFTAVPGDARVTGAVLSMLSSVLGCVGVAVQFSVAFKHVMSVIATPSTTSGLTAGVYAPFALAGGIGASIVTHLTDATLKYYFATLTFALTVASLVQHVVVVVMVKSIDDATFTDKEPPSVDAVVATATTNTSPSTTESTPLVSSDPGVTVSAAASPQEQAASGGPWDVIKSYVTKTDGKLVLALAFFKCMVGPTVSTQTGTMVRSAVGGDEGGPFTEFAVLLTLTLAMTAGRLMPIPLGARKSILGVPSLPFQNMLMTVLLLLATIVPLIRFNNATVFVFALFGGMGYGLVWAVDSPTLLSAARQPSEWSVLVAALLSPVELVASVSANVVVGRLYDVHGTWTSTGVQCTGRVCFEGALIFMAVCSMAAFVCASVMAVRAVRGGVA